MAIDQGGQGLAVLLRNGWSIKRQGGSHRTLASPGRPDFVFAFHDGEESGRECSRELRSGLGCRRMTYEHAPKRFVARPEIRRATPPAFGVRSDPKLDSLPYKFSGLNFRR
jgi:predicted RNA binding protein YcfA (HicA-like mRNA interferase family)